MTAAPTPPRALLTTDQAYLEIAKLSLGPADLAIIRVPSDLTADMHANIALSFSKILKHRRFVIISDDMNITVVRDGIGAMQMTLFEEIEEIPEARN